MCLILFAYQQHPDYPLIVAANRDEFYERPTLPAHHWSQYPQLFAGKDLQAGGTWMGVTKTGRFAAVTNFREASEPPATAMSRGALCVDFLSSTISPEQYLNQLDQHQSDFAGFNILVGTSKNLCYYSNRQRQIIHVAPGIHGLSNGLLNAPWPKVNRGKEALSTVLQQSSNPEELLPVLLDKQRPADTLLPNTGIDLEKERLLSSRFIHSENYGTRSCTIVRMDQQGKTDWLEQPFDSSGPTSTPMNHQVMPDNQK